MSYAWQSITEHTGDLRRGLVSQWPDTPEELYCRMTLGFSSSKPGRHLIPASQGRNGEAIGYTPATVESQRRHSQETKISGAVTGHDGRCAPAGRCPEGHICKPPRILKKPLLGIVMPSWISVSLTGNINQRFPCKLPMLQPTIHSIYRTQLPRIARNAAHTSRLRPLRSRRRRSAR